MVTESLREAIRRLPAVRARLQAFCLRQRTASPPCSAGLQAGTGQLASGHAFRHFARLSARLLLPVAPAFRPAPPGLRQGTPSGVPLVQPFPYLFSGFSR